MAKKRIPEVPRDGSEVDFIPQNFMLIDGAEGSAKMRMDLFAKASSVESLRTDVSGKADKVTGATEGDVATLNANGNLVDSGVKLTPSTNTISANISGNADTATTATKLSTNAGDSDHPCYFSGGIPKQCFGVSTYRLFAGSMGNTSWYNISGTTSPSIGGQYIVTGASVIDLNNTGGTAGNTGCMHIRVKGDGNACCTLTVQYLDTFGNSRSFEIYWGNSSHFTRVNEFVVFWAENYFPNNQTVYRHCTIVPVYLPDLNEWDGVSV